MAAPIYLDHAATTPLRAEARAAMDPYLVENYANPSSVYRMAQSARSALDRARDTVGDCLGATPAEIIFTSGGTESDNAALKGTAFARRETSRHLVTGAIEHHAVLYPLEELEVRFGYELTVLPVPASGIVDPRDVERALRPDTALVSIMWANNEIGTVQPIAEIGALVRARGIPFHVDAVQVAGALPIDLRTMPVDLLSISAHKFYGPKGVGALFVRRGTPWWPILVGGGQERNRRAGTENVAGIAGMAEALKLATSERMEAQARMSALRDYLRDEILRCIPDAIVNGDPDRRLANNLNLSFPGVSGESLLVGLDLAGVMASSGSACTSGSTEPSHVLKAIGLSDALAGASLRLTLGHANTRDEMHRVAEILASLVARLRAAHAVPR